MCRFVSFLAATLSQPAEEALSPMSRNPNYHSSPTTHPYFLDAPKFVRFLFVCASFSLSSVSFFFDLLALLPPADVGVGLLDPLSRNVVDSGVGAGVDPTDPGVEESYNKPSPISKTRRDGRRSTLK
jgi:hypothetical protein